jgi:Spy/CpxP family protein refolding chaperone
MMKETSMKRALIFAALLLGGFAALEASAAGRHAQNGPHGPGMQGYGEQGDWHGGGDHGLASLNLSQSQKDRIAKIRESHQKDMIQSRADLQLAQLEFRKLMRSDDPDKRALNAQIDRMSSIRADMMKSRVDQRLQVRDILTPDQRSKLREGRGGHHDNDQAPPRDEDPRRM